MTTEKDFERQKRIMPNDYGDETSFKNNKYDGRATIDNKKLVTIYEEGFENGKLQTKEELKTQVFDMIDKNDIPIDLQQCCFINIWTYKKDLKSKLKEIFENG